jgi:hypothetical protein
MFPIVVGLMVSASSLAKADPHQDLAHQIKAEIVKVEVEALLDTYRELTQRIHELQLEQVHLEVEVETAGDQAERVALEQQVRRVHITRDRMEHLRAETREKLHHHAEALSQHAHGAGRHDEDHGDQEGRQHEDCGEECKDECEGHEEHGEHEGRHHGDHDGRHHEDAHEGHDDHSSKADVLREKLHYLEREIEEMHDAGKHEHAEKLEHHVREIHQQLEGDEGRHHDGHGEDHERHHQDALREKLHHLEREIEELHDAGKHEHAEKLEHHVREIHQQLEGDAGRHQDDHGEDHDRRHQDALREKLHHLEREIEELHDAGKHEHAEKLEHHVREIHQQLEGDAGRHHDDHDVRHHDGDRAHAKMRAYSEQLQSKRHGVEARLEKLKVALVQIEGDDDEAQKKRRQMKQRMAGLESQHKAIMEKMEGLKRRSGERRDSEHHDHETHKD